MNIKKSIDIAIALRETSNTEVAKSLKMTKQAFSQMKARENLTMKTVESLAGAFGMSASEFIHLGED